MELRAQEKVVTDSMMEPKVAQLVFVVYLTVICIIYMEYCVAN